MKEIKLLEIGTEGGSLTFYAITRESIKDYVIGLNRDKTYRTDEEMLLDYSKNCDPILMYYPALSILEM